MKLVADIKKKRNNLANCVNIFRRSDILYNFHILITVSIHTPKKLKNIFSKLLSLIKSKVTYTKSDRFFLIGSMFK